MDMGVKSDIYNEWLKAQKAGEFEGTFEDYMSTEYGGQFEEGKFVPDEASQETLGGSYRNWTEVAQAYYGGRLDDVGVTKMALAMQSVNPGVNVWSPGQTINLPPISAGVGYISDEQWAQQKDREEAARTGNWGTYYDWGANAPTQDYWGTQVETRGGYTRQKAADQYVAAGGRVPGDAGLYLDEGTEQPRVEAGMSDVALAWNTFLGPYFRSVGYTDLPFELGQGSVGALGPQAYYSGMGTTYVGPGYPTPTPVEDVRAPMAGEVRAALAAAGIEMPSYTPAGTVPTETTMPDLGQVDPRSEASMLSAAPEGWSVVEAESGRYFVFQDPEGRIVPLSQVSEADYTAAGAPATAEQSIFGAIADDPIRAISQVIAQTPGLADALNQDDTSMLSDAQLAALIHFGIWEPGAGTSLDQYPTLPSPKDTKYEYYNQFAPPGLPSYNPSNDYYLPKGYRGRSMYWGLINWRF
jgi:hypothetical protein